MVKNKKGKKKNKMAGRSRPEQASDDKKVPAALSDNSETEDRTDRPSDPRALILEPEALTSDSGFDSGRGSPGDEPVPGLTARVEENSGKPHATGQKSPGDPKGRSATQVNPQNNGDASPKAASKTPPRKEVDETAPVEKDGDERRESDDNKETKMDEQADEPMKKTDSTQEKKGGNPPSSLKSRGAVSLRRPKPVEYIKHPLEFPWQFWILLKDVPWEMALKPLDSFDTAEDFWGLFNRLGNPRVMDQPILMFKKHVKPEWEDPRNQSGGRWSLTQGLSGRLAERVWQELALMMIGGIQFGNLTPHLNGIYATWKNDGIHFAVWLDTIEEHIARPIGNTIHRELQTHAKNSFTMELTNFATKGRKRPIITIR